MIKTVKLSYGSQKDLRRLPRHVVINLMKWVDDVEERGLEEVRKIPGYHDEPLIGDRKGQRSIRLTRAYRAIYLVQRGVIELVEVLEVTKHDY